MITVENFEQRYVRLGNQLFQFAVLFAINQRRGHEYFLSHDDEDLWRAFDLEVAADGPPCTHRYEEAFGSCNYDPLVFEQPDGTSFRGYFQSYRYLEECKASLLRTLRFKFAHRALTEAMLFAMRRRYRRPLVSLHVRRGDYVNASGDWGDLAADGYYDRAVRAIGDGAAYIVFSDDLPWCREFFDIEPVEFPDLDPYQALCMMSRCDVNVVANSSFSWWGAFMNPGGEAYVPGRWWRNAAPPNQRQDDIVPPYWRTIPTFSTDSAVH